LSPSSASVFRGSVSQAVKAVIAMKMMADKRAKRAGFGFNVSSGS